MSKNRYNSFYHGAYRCNTAMVTNANGEKVKAKVNGARRA